MVELMQYGALGILAFVVAAMVRAFTGELRASRKERIELCRKHIEADAQNAVVLGEATRRLEDMRDSLVEIKTSLQRMNGR